MDIHEERHAPRPNIPGKPGPQLVQFLCLVGACLAAQALAGPKESLAPKADLYVSVDDTSAELSVDGMPQAGRRQFALEGIKAGHHLLTAKAPHRTASLEVTLRRNEIRHVTLRLRAATTGVRLVSDPFQAQVFEGPELLGTTPFQAEALTEGSHQLTFRKEGHLDTTVHLNTDSTRRLSVRLVPAGTLAVDPECPIELMLQRGGGSLTRPASGQIPLPAGIWRVRTVHPDWIPLDTSVTILPGKTTSLAMHRLWARLSIDVKQPTMAWLDGKALGTVPHILEEMTPGNHRLVLRSAGYREVIRDVRLAPGEALLIKLDLDSLEGRPRTVPAPRFEEE